MKANFGFLLYPGVEELDVVGPWEVIKFWSEKFAGPDKVFTVSEQGGLISCARGLRIDSDYTFQNCPKLDFILIPGGPGRREEVNNASLIDFIRIQAKNSQQVLSVCTGAFLLQKAGLLKGVHATTYWEALNEFKQFPEIIVTEKRWVRDGKIWTGAGVSSGIDLALALIAEITDKETAGKVQMATEYFPPQKNYADLKNVKNAPDYLKEK